MTDATMVDGLPLFGVWTFWHIKTRKPGVSAIPPPMPPLEDWPKDALETLEHLTKRRRARRGTGP